MALFSRDSKSSHRRGPDFLPPAAPADANRVDALLLRTLEHAGPGDGPRYWLNRVSFDSMEAARAAESELHYRGWPQRTSVVHAVDNRAWVLAAWSDSILAAHLLEDSRAYFDMLAARHHGTFLGWSGSFGITSYDPGSEFGNFAGRTLGWPTDADLHFLEHAREGAERWDVDSPADLERAVRAERGVKRRRAFGRNNFSAVLNAAGALTGDYWCNHTGALWMTYGDSENYYLCVLDPHTLELRWPFEMAARMWEAGGEGLAAQLG